MKSYLYAVYDRLGNSYGSLVEYHTDGAAIRDFKKMYGKGVTADPSQYELHKIACVIRDDGCNPDFAGLSVFEEKNGKGAIYNYTAYVSERLDGNALIDQIALLEQEDIDKVSDFVKTLKGGNENGSI